jgi:nitrogen fixation NifU-like protein
MDLYQEIILDHYHNPRNFGNLPDGESARAENPSCGDTLTFSVHIEKGIVRDIAFTGSGCAISIAGASILSEYAKGKSMQELSEISKDAMLKLLGVPVSAARMKCALLPLETLQKALQNTLIT